MSQPFFSRLTSVLVVFCLAGILTACESMQGWPVAGDTGGAQGSSTASPLVNAVRQTLVLSSDRATTALSAPGGYANNPALRITLPSQLDTVTQTLRQFGMGQYVDKLEARMNEGAEQAAVEAKEVFLTTIREMSITDALGIVRGGDTAATDYFRSQTESTLRQRYQPIIRQNLEKVGFYDQYRLVLDVYNTLPVSNRLNLDLEQYVLNQGLDGLFGRMAEEEQLIRRDPLGRGSQVINAIFGG